MIKLKIPRSDNIIRHNLGREFNNSIDDIVMSAVMGGFNLSCFENNFNTTKGDKFFILYITTTYDAFLNIVFATNAYNQLVEFRVYDHFADVRINENVIEYCLKRLVEVNS